MPNAIGFPPGDGMKGLAILIAMALFSALLFSGCIAPAKVAPLPQLPNVSAPAAPMVGNDRDSHGCIGSAGYTWCEALSKCIRPWEENCTAPVPNGSAASGPLVGNDSDSHGCKGSAGYTWCDVLQKCIRPWEENCTSGSLEATAQSYCGKDNVAGVYICGDYVKVVSSLAGAGSTFYANGTGRPITCPVVSPEYMPPDCGELFSGNYCNDTKVC